MKIKKLATQISRVKQLCLIDCEEGEQWAGTSSAFYLLPESLPEMDSELLTLIMDIKPEKAAEFFVEHKNKPLGFPVGDTAPEESELYFDMSNRLIYDGTDILPLKTQGGGMYYIKTSQLAPVDDVQQMGIYLRIWGNRPIIAVKDGLFLVALIMPILHKSSFVPWLADVYMGTKGTEIIRKERAEE